jgi:peptidoglycan hydrolase CwlO-like protein|tara:strand:- start:15 stop:248 length:234 start_codon:yes stop_codon:yes gene_type:complete
MADVNVEQDLESVMSEIKRLVAEAQTLEATRTQLTQQIQQLNGVAMYLRGKQPEAVEAVEAEVKEQAEPETTPIQEE